MFATVGLFYKKNRKKKLKQIDISKNGKLPSRHLQISYLGTPKIRGGRRGLSWISDISWFLPQKAARLDIQDKAGVAGLILEVQR